MKSMIKKDRFKELGCDFLGPEECEEELDDERLSEEEAEQDHFGEKSDIRSGEIE